MKHNAIGLSLARIAREAGDILLTYRHSPNLIIHKPDGSPSTTADHEAEAHILAALAREFPHIPVVSEENARSHAQNPEGAFFLVDPLDGTRGYIDGNPAFCVLIALIDHATPVAAALDAPMLNLLLWAGEDAFLSTSRQVSDCQQLPYSHNREPNHIAIISSHHARRVSFSMCQKLGATKVLDEPSAVKFARLACGEADFYPRYGQTMQWDVAAGDALLRATGGGVFDTQGKRLCYGAGAAAKGWTMPDFVALARADEHVKIAPLNE